MWERVYEQCWKAWMHAWNYSAKLRERAFEHWQRGANQRTIVILIVIGILSLFAYLKVISAPSGFPVGDLVSINDGESMQQISAALGKQNVVRNATALRILVRLLGRDNSVRAGDYLFNEPKDIFSIARAITTGAYGLEPLRIRIPEGATTKEMARIFSARLKRVNESDFLTRAHPLEGYLFPDTYFFLPNATADKVIAALRQNFDAHIEKIAGDIASYGKPLPEVVIMASILEKEARSTEDRRMIAGVLWRRLKQHMPLQVDVTFLYLLGKNTFQLTSDDLKMDSPYNTYRYVGLPPAPINSPSIDSIQAAVHPIDKGYLYYLADKNGTTHYSKTYDEHVRKKALYLGT